MACGEFGPGRMREPEAIQTDLAKLLSAREHEPAPTLAGKRVVVTAGPTREAIDPVRYIQFE